MTRPFGYYVHHQGAGHLHRARIIASELSRPCRIIGSFEADDGDVLSLPSDQIDPSFAGLDKTPHCPEAFHYAPIGVAGVRDRMAMIASWIASADPALFIVDVSVEISLFVRLMSVPLVVVRLSGERTDRPHLEAFRAAEALLCPYPEILEMESTPKWVRAKSIFGGFLAKPSSPFPSTRVEEGRVAVVFGRGGIAPDIQTLIKAAATVPKCEWHIYGPIKPLGQVRPNLNVHGWISDIGAAIDQADIVVGGAGDDLLAKVAARNKPFVCIPEDRPFDEQRVKAQRLASLGIVLTLDRWPEAANWGDILNGVKALRSNWRSLYRADAVKEVCQQLNAIADHRSR
jgi:UDP-N-acetylglucosamine--N-acetylmuramyl-(pentapeptide) pyrophosphoryl-undecaprenol N-acetylglucosamine transferase